MELELSSSTSVLFHNMIFFSIDKDCYSLDSVLIKDEVYYFKKSVLEMPFLWL